MKLPYKSIRALACLLALLIALCGCGAVSELVKPYEKELGELGDALVDQLLDAELDGTVLPSTTKTPETTKTPSTEKASETTKAPSTTKAPETTKALPDKNGSYTSRDDVAAYIAAYGELPQNFITKNEARALGWDSSAGNLAKVAPGKSIGGDKFGNYEGLLPKKSGRQYYECDIDYTGGHRNAKRIVFSNDGLIFYTEDHYETFKELKP